MYVDPESWTWLKHQENVHGKDFMSFLEGLINSMRKTRYYRDKYTGEWKVSKFQPQAGCYFPDYETCVKYYRDSSESQM